MYTLYIYIIQLCTHTKCNWTFIWYKMYKHHQWEHHSDGVGSRLPWSICVHSLRKPAAMSADVAEPPFLLVNWTWISTSTACESGGLVFSFILISAILCDLCAQSARAWASFHAAIFMLHVRIQQQTRTTGLCSWNMGIILKHHGKNKLSIFQDITKKPCGCTATKATIQVTLLQPRLNAENPPEM